MHVTVINIQALSYTNFHLGLNAGSVFCTHKCNVRVTDIYTECIMYFQVLHVFSASDLFTTLALYKCVYLLTYVLSNVRAYREGKSRGPLLGWF